MDVGGSEAASERWSSVGLFLTLSIVALTPVLVEGGGFELSPGELLAFRISNFVFVGLFIFEYVLAFRRAPRSGFLRGVAAELTLVALFGLVLLIEVFHPFGLFEASGLLSLVIPAQIFLVLNLVLKTLRLFQAAAQRGVPAARAFALSFVAIILLGAVLLYLLPAAKAEGRELGFVDALFTSTSATCVTGLVTKDTGKDFSPLGQTIILVLFQLGGLGLMTFASFFALTLGKGMGIRDREAMKNVLNLRVSGSVGRVVVGILAITVVVEGISTLVLYLRCDPGPGQGRFFYALFHGVSAFCNAGFSLNSDSLSKYVADPVVNITVMAAIVIGGLGFGVILDLLSRRPLGARFFRWIRLLDRRDTEARGLTVQTRIVLISSATLILLGAAFFLAVESAPGRPFAGMEAGERVQAALFQSVTTRTAGFNTVDIGSLSDASKFLMVAFMMIGASPGSTGGGLKTVTTVVLLLTVISLYRNRERVEVFGRTLPHGTVNRALVICVTAFVLVTLASLVLAIAEAGADRRFVDLFFEAGSAFGTVGLSTGITAKLTLVSKLTICVLMFVGRIGPLALVLALSQVRPARSYEYPEEHVMIG